MSNNINPEFLENLKTNQNELNQTSSESIKQIRQNALKAFESLGYPTHKQENWKYDNLSFINKHNFQINPDLNYSLEFSDIEKFLFKDLKENLLVFVNGSYQSNLSQIRLTPNKLKIGSFKEFLQNEDENILKHYARYAQKNDEAFVALNTSMANDGAYIYIPDGEVIEDPIHLLFINDTRAGNFLSMPRNLIIVGDCSQVRIVESTNTIGVNTGFTNSVTEIVSDRFSNVDYCKIQNDDSGSYYIGTTQVIQERGSVFVSSTISLNGKFIRNDLNSSLNDELCQSNYSGFYFIDKEDFVDNHTLVDHLKPNCVSKENYKGIISDKATAVFNGRIIVYPDAQKTNAYQSNRNILLTDTAQVFTKPQLEIYADDVKCSHGATSGYLNKEEMFYLRSRGIDEEKAKAILLNSFASEVVEKISISELRDDIKRQIAERLNVADIYFCDVLEQSK